MMNPICTASRQAWSWVLRNWDQVYLLLDVLDLVRDQRATVEPLELAFEDAFRPVSPSEGFREQLRDNLTLAARHRQQGPIVESRRPYREALLLAVSTTVVAATVAAAFALTRWHPHRTIHRG